jgi:hypothetical protein
MNRSETVGSSKVGLPGTLHVQRTQTGVCLMLCQTANWGHTVLGSDDIRAPLSTTSVRQHLLKLSCNDTALG